MSGPAPALARALDQALAELRAEHRAAGREPFGFEVLHARGRTASFTDRWPEVVGLTVVGRAGEDGEVVMLRVDVDGERLAARPVRRSKPRMK